MSSGNKIQNKKFQLWTKFFFLKIMNKQREDIDFFKSKFSEKVGSQKFDKQPMLIINFFYLIAILKHKNSIMD